MIIFSGRNTVLPSHQPQRERSPISPTTNERCHITDWMRMAFTASLKVRIDIWTAIIPSILGKRFIPLNFASFPKWFTLFRNLLQQLSSPSPQLSSYNCYSPYIVSDGAPLSVLGNAIAPERKPPVPTMSERDLTRRHNACFTRNRSICP